MPAMSIKLARSSANLSASVLKQRDNDVIILRGTALAERFAARFEKLWETSKPVPKSGNLLAGEAPKGRPVPTCAINGNINAHGERIYHLPGSRNYTRVAMNDSDERWFCSEPEAKAAGWRPTGRCVNVS
jgi:hypothetical protein